MAEPLIAEWFGNIFDEAVSAGCTALLFAREHWEEFDAWVTVMIGQTPTPEVYRQALAVLDSFTPTGQEARRGVQ